MRIVHVSPFYNPSVGGIETFCRELAIRTAELGHEVHVITYTSGSNAEPYDRGVRVHRLEPLFKWYKTRYSPQLPSLLKQLKPDIVHVHAPAAITEEQAMVGGSGHVATYHNDPYSTDPYERKSPSYRLSRWVYTRVLVPKFCSSVDRVIFATKSFQDASPLLRSVPQAKKHVIPIGVDVAVFCPSQRAKRYYRENLGLGSKHVGIFVASMEKWHTYKGFPVLLQALARLRDYDLQFLVVGDGFLRNKYERLAQLLSLRKVKFLGWLPQSDLVDALRASDFLVLPSTGVETFGTVLIEAMACGIPVIASDLPGPRDVVQEGKNGYKVTPGDHDQLANTILKFLSLPADAKARMQSYARTAAVEKYDWTKIVDQYQAEYVSVAPNLGI